MKALLLAGTLALGPSAVAQTTYTVIGDTSFGSDGSTVTTVGGTTFVSGASPVIHHSLGGAGKATNTQGATSTATKIGNITFVTGSDGVLSTVQTIGGITFGSDGSTVQKIGNTYFLNKGASKDGN